MWSSRWAERLQLRTSCTPARSSVFGEIMSCILKTSSDNLTIYIEPLTNSGQSALKNKMIRRIPLPSAFQTLNRTEEEHKTQLEFIWSSVDFGLSWTFFNYYLDLQRPLQQYSFLNFINCWCFMSQSKSIATCWNWSTLQDLLGQPNWILRWICSWWFVINVLINVSDVTWLYVTERWLKFNGMFEFPMIYSLLQIPH